MATLNPGQWAVDGGYWHEEVDLYACAGMKEYDQDWEGEELGWGDAYFDDAWDQRIRLESFETDTFLGSLEYGFCENLDLYVRLGMTEAEGDVVYRGGDWEQVWDEEEEEYVWVWEPWEDKYSADFGSAFTWQVGTRFTICRSGAWTWGGRMQFGMTQGASASESYYYTEDEVGEGTIRYIETGAMDADLDWWQAVAYVGPTYQLSDALQVYFGGGWQTLQGKLEVDETWVEEEYYVTEGEEGEELEQYYGDKDTYEASFKLKHASAIAVFGAAWAPTEQINIGVDALIGEGGKWGIGVSGAYAF